MKTSANIGTFDTPATFRQPTRAKTATSMGQVVETFADFQDVWVQMTRVGGGETVARMQVDDAEFYEIKGHYIDGVDSTFRVEIDGQEYHILDVFPLDRKKWMLCKVTKVLE